MGRKVLASEDRYLPEGLSWPEDMEYLLFPFKGDLKYLHPACDTHIKACCLITLSKYGLPPSEDLIRHDHGKIFLLLLWQTFKEGDGGNVFDNLHNSTINHSDKCGVGEVIDNIKATVVLVDLKHPAEIQIEGMAKNDTIYSAVANQKDIIIQLIF